MGHNRSISSANDVYISPIDGAIDIVLLRWCRKRKCHRRSGLWLFFSYSITDSDVLATISTRSAGYYDSPILIKDDDHGKKVAVVKAEIEAVRVNIS